MSPNEPEYWYSALYGPEPGLYLWCRKCNHHEKNTLKQWVGRCDKCGTKTVGTDVVDIMSGGTIRW